VDRHADPRQRVLAVFGFLAEWFAEPGFRGCAFINAFGELSSESRIVSRLTLDHKARLLRYLTGLSVWRNRDEFISGRAAIVEFLRRKWDRELGYALRKELWSFHGNRIAVRFQYESHNEAGQWFRSYGNELWEFTEEGLMRRREASINDLAIDEADRRISGPRPESERGVPFPLR
jgi:uncharacterized protein